MTAVTSIVNTSESRAKAAPEDGVVVSVILPAFNEGLALPTVLRDVLASLRDVGEHEVIVVDDASTDDTASIAAAFPCLLVQHRENLGKGAALRTGFRAACGRHVVVMDADATYPAEAIPQIVSLLAQNDVVRGVRQISGQNMHLTNRIGNAIFTFVTRALGLGGSDPLSGLYGMRRNLWQRMDLEAAGFDIEAEIGIKARSLGLRVATLPITYRPRLGETKLSAWGDGRRILSRILSMALLHNPALTFVLPGLCVIGLAVITALVLREGPLIAPYLGFSTGSLILASLGVLAGFQLVVFGVAAQLYAVEAGYRPRSWLVRLSRRPVRLSAAAAGAVLFALGAIATGGLALGWPVGGAGSSTQTKSLVLAATGIFWGLQVISAALFLSIFPGRLANATGRAKRET